jgi:hypothetical protein
VLELRLTEKKFASRNWKYIRNTFKTYASSKKALLH